MLELQGGAFLAFASQDEPFEVTIEKRDARETETKVLKFMIKGPEELSILDWDHHQSLLRRIIRIWCGVLLLPQ
jgi:hypothetical protein